MSFALTKGTDDGHATEFSCVAWNALMLASLVETRLYCKQNTFKNLNFVMLVTLYKIGQVSFHLIGTIPGFSCKVKDERFTAAESRCHQNLKSKSRHVFVLAEYVKQLYQREEPAARAAFNSEINSPVQAFFLSDATKFMSSSKSFAVNT